VRVFRMCVFHGDLNADLRMPYTCRREERDRMSQVLHHPTFLSNPLEAVLGHLEATLPPAPTRNGVQSMKE
jgi:hypothetical protein